MPRESKSSTETNMTKMPCPCCGQATEANRLIIDVGSSVACYNGRIAYLTPRQMIILQTLLEVWPNGMSNNDLVAKLWGRSQSEWAHKSLAVQIHRINTAFRGWGIEVSKGVGQRSIRYQIGGER